MPRKMTRAEAVELCVKFQSCLTGCSVSEWLEQEGLIEIVEEPTLKELIQRLALNYQPEDGISKVPEDLFYQLIRVQPRGLWSEGER